MQNQQFSAFLKSKVEGGSLPRIRNVRAGAGIRQLPERVYLQDAQGHVRDSSRINLPGLQEAHSLL